MTEREIQKLVEKFLNGTASDEEEAKLHKWYDKKGFDSEEIMIDTDGESKQDVKERLFNAISAKKENTGKNQLVRNRRVLRLSYAAAILIFLLSGTYFYFINNSNKEPIHYTQLMKNDVGPAGENAILEFDDGKLVGLDSTKIHDSLNSYGVALTKDGHGMLSLSIKPGTKGLKNRTNTIRTPKGGHFHLILSDGTKVWLNASTLIRFPSSFTDAQREIYLEGEAYFEVAKVQNFENKNIPFIIKTQQQQITVLGTNFNVSSYPNDENERTTLSEGSVKVSPRGSDQFMLLKPGEQSLVQENTVTKQLADLESTLAWKDGDFIFNHENLFDIMKKIERWYDVEVVFDEDVNKNRTFSGAVSRSRNLSDVLELLKMTGKVNFKIEGRRVFVMT